MPKGYPTHFTDEQIAEMVRLYETGLFVEDVGQHFGISYGAVQNIFHKIGYKPRSARRLYTINENVFDTIDNELAAYWLGFIYADGYVFKTTLQVILAGKDGHHLYKLRDFLGSDTPIAEENYIHPRSRLTVSGIHLSDRLKELGVLVRRPIPDVMYSQVHEGVVHHWLRGFFDGDGGAHAVPALSFVGQERLLIIIRELLARRAGRNPSLSVRPFRHSPSICHLGYNHFHNARAVTDFMYQDATVWLPRKRERIDGWVTPRSNSERSRLGWETWRLAHPSTD